MSTTTERAAELLARMCSHGKFHGWDCSLCKLERVAKRSAERRALFQERLEIARGLSIKQRRERQA